MARTGQHRVPNRRNLDHWSQGPKPRRASEHSATILDRTMIRYAYIQLILLFEIDFKKAKRRCRGAARLTHALVCVC
jgi:hypothetical protein